MDLTTLVRRNLSRRPVRSVLTLGVVAVAVGCVTLLVGIALGFERSFCQLYAEAGVDLVVVRAGTADRLSSSLSEALGPRIAEIDGVRDVSPGLCDVLSIEEAGLMGVFAHGWEPASPLFDRFRLQAGTLLPAPTPTETEEPLDPFASEPPVVLGSVLARNWGKAVGDRVEVLYVPCRVVGVIESSNVLENGALYMRLGDLQAVLDRPGQVTGYSVRVLDPTNTPAIERIDAAISALDPTVDALSARDHVQSLLQLRLVRSMAWATSGIALLVGIIVLLNTMLIAVHERVREIGVLRAVGWSTRRVVQAILLEGAFLGLFGGLIGVALALVLALGLAWVPATAGLLEARLDLDVILIAIALAFAVGVIGAVFPARHAARLVPTDALRYEG